MVIMQLLPSVVRGLVISRSVGRWNLGQYHRLQLFLTSTPFDNHSDDARDGCFPTSHRTICSLSNTNEFSAAEDSHKNEGVVVTVDDDSVDDSQEPRVPVWNHPAIQARVAKKKRDNKLRFRQHVNPLSRMYQQPTILPKDWPTSVYKTVPKRPLHLDIGCGKGGFLIDLCQAERSDSDNSSVYNYLGLEIRPGVATYAKDRVAVHELQGLLDFLGCNANVDLDRILNLYQSHYAATAPDSVPHDLCLHRVTIQFPDPHFKSQHLKRRVVTNKLVDTIAKYMPMNATIILQSDIQAVLDDMRRQFRESNATPGDAKINGENKHSTAQYFIDSMGDYGQYIPENCLGVPTEREQSVLNHGLPVFRSLLTRSSCPYQNLSLEDSKTQSI